jgi:hypothetical protein
VLLKELGGDADYDRETGGYWERWIRGRVDPGRMRCAWPEYSGGCASHTVVRKII